MAFYTHIVKWDRKKIKHEKDKALRLVEELGAPVRDRETELSIPQKDLEYIDKYLNEKGINQSELLVTIAPQRIISLESMEAGAICQCCLRNNKKI